jgi:hypothetical protein
MSEFNSNITEKFEVFKKVLSKYIQNIDIDGIKFELTNHTALRRVQGFNLEVPLIKILNPKSIPFSYNSLSDLLSIELSTVNQFTKTFSSNIDLERSFDFYDFNNNDYFIPNKIENDLLKCLHNNYVEIKYRYFNIIYTIKGRYLIDNNFEVQWNDSESFQIYISFNVDSIFVDDLASKEFYFLDDRESMVNVVNDIYYEDSTTFENGIWYCFEDTLIEYRTFLNTEWQFINVRPLPI